MYKLYADVILDKSDNEDYIRIEKQRSYLLRQRNLLETTDFGASAAGNEYKTRFRKVNDVTRHSSVDIKIGKFLHRMVSFAEPEDVLEIGTAMGISTMYIAKAAPESRMVTMEGCAVIADKAKESFQNLEINNIELALGNFNTLLGKTLHKFEKLDFVFVDGNHRKEPTLEYFNTMLPKLHLNSFVVIDDIHWSKGMTQAWNEIRKHPRVSISIDLFRCGILLFRKDIAKEHFTLRF